MKNQPLIERLEDKFIPVTESGCWLWIGATTGKTDYGRIKDPRINKYVVAHQLAYELYRGPVPEHTALTHTCELHCCINPWHLKIVPSYTGLSLRGRFDAKWKLVEDSDCWIWTATIGADGYGSMRVGRKMCRAHRIAYELYREAIPKGLHIDHLCRVRHCVNPWHLDTVTPDENVRRGIAGILAGARMSAKTHCPHGHEYTPNNTFIGRNGYRKCRTCGKLRKRDAKCIHAVAADNRREG